MTPRDIAIGVLLGLVLLAIALVIRSDLINTPDLPRCGGVNCPALAGDER